METFGKGHGVNLCISFSGYSIDVSAFILFYFLKKNFIRFYFYFIFKREGIERKVEICERARDKSGGRWRGGAFGAGWPRREPWL